MPTFRRSSELDIHYTVDDCTDPWRVPETVLMLHGNAESGLAWYGWVPALSRQYRVVRPDMRGFGRSTPMPRDHRWTLDELVADVAALLEHLGIDRVHLVGAKLGGTLARAFAARRPHLVSTLTVVGTPAPFRVGVAEKIPQILRLFEEKGVEAWARANMGSRLGDSFPPEGVEWWIEYMGRTDLDTQIGFTRDISAVDITDDLPHIACPTLAITTEASALGSVAETQAWVDMIPGARLLVLPGNSYHVAATHAADCAAATKDFLQSH